MINIRRTSPIDVINFLLIPIIGLGGVGFSWYYTVETKPVPSDVQITYQKPMVLGAYAEKDESTEGSEIKEMFYQEPQLSSGFSIDITDELLPKEVDSLFLNYCDQQEYEDDLHQWFCNNKEELEQALNSDSTDEQE